MSEEHRTMLRRGHDVVKKKRFRKQSRQELSKERSCWISERTDGQQAMTVCEAALDFSKQRWMYNFRDRKAIFSRLIQEAWLWVNEKASRCSELFQLASLDVFRVVRLASELATG